MKYYKINEADTANGTGIRVSLFCSGCRHACPGCFNYELRDHNYGQDFTQETIDKIISLLDKEYINGLSLLGGEPLDPDNFSTTLDLVQQVRKKLPHKTIWCYTGYLYENINEGKEKGINNKIFNYIDVLVDGKFLIKQADRKLKFRGSSNQRVINIPETQKQKRVIWSTAIDDKDKYYQE